MRGQIAVGSGMKIKRSAEIKDNAEVKDTLRQIKLAIQEGRLDHVWTLTTYDLTGEINENGIKRTQGRNMTISEIDQQIEDNRNEKIQNIEFALDQMALFSKYLKKNVHASYQGYSASMILNFIPNSELRKIIDIVLDEKQKIESSDFVEGQNNSFVNGVLKPESLRDRLQASLSNQYNLKLEDQK